MLSKDNLKIGIIVLHARNNKPYRILDFVKCKHPNTGKWYDAVYYKLYHTNSTYVRSTEEFLNKFKPVDRTANYSHLFNNE